MTRHVVVLGAGPAGSAAAIALRREGVEVTLVDRHDFPRDKVCGDALLPDAYRALGRLGLEEKVAAEARSLSGLRLHAPNGRHVDLPGTFGCLPRSVLDAILQKGAVDAGARFLGRRKAVGPIEEEGRVVGARLRPVPEGSEEEIRADATILATGAATAPLEAFGVLTREEPSAIALRAYYEVPEDLLRDHLVISYDAAVCPGYGWIFPGPGSVLNLGVGFFHDSPKPPVTTNPRELWARFVDGFAPAREIVARGRLVAPIKGAPLRCGLGGARFHRPGLLVVGEAVGTTYSFSGEGIGKAMESGLLAADALVDSASGDAGAAYEAGFRSRYAERYRAYRIAQSWLAWPSLSNLLSHRAARGTFVRRQLAGMVDESVDPRALFSVGGIVRSLLG